MSLHRFSAAITRGIAVSVLAIGLRGVGGSAARAQRYTVLDLGTLGGADSGAGSLNSYGYAVGRARTALPTGEQHAAFFSVFWGVWDLTPALPSPYQSVASGINDSFQICGSQYLGGGAVAWVTTLGAPYPTYIGTLGGNYSIANRINASGQVVGSSDDYLGRRRAFVWNAGSFTALGTLATTWTSYSFGDGINDLGHVVGDSGTDAFQQHAFFWPGAGPLKDLGTLGGDTSSAVDINDRGIVVGSATDVQGRSRAFVYAQGEMRELPVPGEITGAVAINRHGDIVGTIGSPSASTVLDGFLYSHGRTALLKDLVLESDCWAHLEPRDINDRGDIVAVGVMNEGASCGAAGRHVVIVTRRP